MTKSTWATVLDPYQRTKQIYYLTTSLGCFHLIGSSLPHIFKSTKVHKFSSELENWTQLEHLQFQCVVGPHVFTRDGNLSRHKKAPFFAWLFQNYKSCHCPKRNWPWHKNLGELVSSDWNAWGTSIQARNFERNMGGLLLKKKSCMTSGL